jgi:hypothetical protein
MWRCENLRRFLRVSRLRLALRLQETVSGFGGSGYMRPRATAYRLRQAVDGIGGAGKEQGRYDGEYSVGEGNGGGRERSREKANLRALRSTSETSWLASREPIGEVSRFSHLNVKEVEIRQRDFLATREVAEEEEVEGTSADVSESRDATHQSYDGSRDHDKDSGGPGAAIVRKRRRLGPSGAGAVQGRNSSLLQGSRVKVVDGGGGGAGQGQEELDGAHCNVDVSTAVATGDRRERSTGVDMSEVDSFLATLNYGEPEIVHQGGRRDQIEEEEGLEGGTE